MTTDSRRTGADIMAQSLENSEFDTELGRRLAAIRAEIDIATWEGVEAADIEAAVENENRPRLAAYRILGIIEDD